MKTLTITLALIMAMSSPVFAASRRPSSGIALCNWNVQETANRAGYKNPWWAPYGENARKWTEFTDPLYNDCSCLHKAKPFKDGTCDS